jgi:site-specific DNA-methyltransferase (adenine-specific)
MAEKVVIGNAELWHGDCREVLPLLPRVDLMLTDPPYGIGIDGQKESVNRNPKHNRKAHDFLGWDNETPERLVFELLRYKSAGQIVWGGNYFTDKLPHPTTGWLFWDKGQRGLTMSDGELAWTSYAFPMRAYTLNRVALQEDGGTDHPTQKPLRLMTWCLGLVPDAATVCDPFMGSGTSGVACAQMGRQFYGIERERKYFDIACERISRAQAQGSLIPLEQTPVAEQQAMDL